MDQRVVMDAQAYPSNLDAERSVLGAILVRTEALRDVADLQPSHFYRLAHQHIFQALLDLEARGSVLDFVTLKSELDRRGLLDECGGAVYIAALADGVPRATNVLHYAGLVRAEADRRALVEEGDRLRRLGLLGETPTDELRDIAVSRLLAFDRSHIEGEARDATETYHEMVPVLTKLWSEGGRRGVQTGIEELDRLTRGFKPGELVVVGARPSMGKSALLLQMALKAAETVPVLLCSLEMSRQELFLRAVSMLTGRYSTDIVAGDLKPTPSAQEVVGRAMAEYATRQLWIDETGGLKVARLRTTARRVQHRSGLGLVLVDYLQLLRGEGGRRDDTRATELGRISADLKALAKELGVPIVAASQLNRDVEHRADKRPSLADLRESGAIEQDADIALLLHRPAYYDRSQDDTYAELQVAKQRNGPTGIVRLRWASELTTFHDWPTRP